MSRCCFDSTGECGEVMVVDSVEIVGFSVDPDFVLVERETMRNKDFVRFVE